MPTHRCMALYSNNHVMQEMVMENAVFKMADIVSVTSTKPQAHLHLISLHLGDTAMLWKSVQYSPMVVTYGGLINQLRMRWTKLHWIIIVVYYPWKQLHVMPLCMGSVVGFHRMFTCMQTYWAITTAYWQCLRGKLWNRYLIHCAICITKASTLGFLRHVTSLIAMTLTSMRLATKKLIVSNWCAWSESRTASFMNGTDLSMKAVVQSWILIRLINFSSIQRNIWITFQIRNTVLPFPNCEPVHII